MSDASLSSVPNAPQMPNAAPNDMPPMDEPMPDAPQDEMPMDNEPKEDNPSKEKKEIQKEIGSACQKFRDYQGEDKEELSKWIEGMLDSLNDDETEEAPEEEPEEMPEEMPQEEPMNEEQEFNPNYESNTEISRDINGNVVVLELNWNNKRNYWELTITNNKFDEMPNDFRCDNPDRGVALKLAKKYVRTHSFSDDEDMDY